MLDNNNYIFHYFFSENVLYRVLLTYVKEDLFILFWTILDRIPAVMHEQVNHFKVGNFHFVEDKNIYATYG